MQETFLVFRHEFLKTITGTGFIVMTFAVLSIPLVLLLGLGFFGLAQGEGNASSSEEMTIGYVDRAGPFKAFTLQNDVTLMLYDTTEEAQGALQAGEIQEYFVIPADYATTGLIHRYTRDKELEVPRRVAAAIRSFLLGNLIEGEVPPMVADRIYEPLRLTTTTLTAEGEMASDQGGLGALLLPAAFSLLIGISLITLSSFLLQGLGEEKENRLIEILLSSVSTRQLLTGKVLGVGAAGLVQVLVWLLLPAFLLHQASTTLLSGVVRSLLIPGEFVALAVTYFVLGYLFFGVLSAGIAAISPTARDGQQLALGFLMPMFVPLWFSSLVMFFPHNPVWTALTFVPITAPTMVMVRYGVTDIAVWELALSITLMVLAVAGGLWLAAKMFRAYLLMYGKRPALAEVFRALRTA